MWRPGAPFGRVSRTQALVAPHTDDRAPWGALGSPLRRCGVDGTGGAHEAQPCAPGSAARRGAGGAGRGARLRGGGGRRSGPLPPAAGSRPGAAPLAADTPEDPINVTHMKLRRFHMETLWKVRAALWQAWTSFLSAGSEAARSRRARVAPFRRLPKSPWRRGFDRERKRGATIGERHMRTSAEDASYGGKKTENQQFEVHSAAGSEYNLAQRPSGPAAQRPSGPAAQRPSGPAAQRPSGPAAQRPSGPAAQRPELRLAAARPLG